MKAAVYKKYGPPGVVKLIDVPKPQAGTNEIIIKINSTTVNRTDCAMRSGAMLINRVFNGLFTPNNQILCNEFAGTVESIGRDVTLFKIGDKVFGYDEKKFGAHAEFKAMNENEAITQMPGCITFVQAAAATEGAHYALSDIRAMDILPNQKILIHGATGGIGSAAVQIAKYYGAYVVATCAANNLASVKSLGADLAIDYTSQDFTKLNESFDVVYDAVGKNSFAQCKPILKPNGIYKSTELGKNAENIFLALVTPWFKGKKVIFPIPSINKNDILFLKGLVEAKKISPLIDRIYPFEKISEAYEYVDTGQKIGNVIIKIAD